MTVAPILPDLGAPEAPGSFAALGVPPELVASLERSGIRIPFPIQAAALPDALAGRDVCGKAPTGSGKTLAFGLAVLARLPDRGGQAERGGRPARGRPESGRPSALILVPTRELAAQVEEALTQPATAVGARVTSVYGGVSYGKQRAALRRGVDVLVACPGRLEDLIQQGDVDLAHASMVVIDEADRMADMGFLPSVRRLVDLTRSDRQTMLFSATLEGPVDKLIRDYQHSPARHDVAGDEERTGEVHHHFWRADAHDRVTITAEVVAARGPAMVFCRTKRGADRLAERLSRSGIEVAAIHGDRSQAQRERALAAFRAGRVHALVATDVAARGIHVDSVPLVVHYDPPADATDYVHRSGRTARAGADGIVVSLVSADHIPVARRMQRQLGLDAVVTAPDVAALPRIVVPPRAPSPALRSGEQAAGRSERPRSRSERARGRGAKTTPSGPPARRRQPTPRPGRGRSTGR